MVIDVLTEGVRDGSLMELLYADDLVLCGEPLNEVIDKYCRWKNVAKVNIDNKKGYNYCLGRKVVFFESESLWSLW